MAPPVKIRPMAGGTRTAGSIQVPVNTQDLAAAVEQLQASLNAVMARFNVHVHASSGAGAPTVLLDGTTAAASGLFTTPPTS